MCEQAKVFFGSIVSYAVVASSRFNETLKSIDRNVLAIETESAGVFEAARKFETPAITIRGVSDFANNEKSELEEITNDKVREFAAKNAALYIRYQLLNSRIIEYLKERERVLVHGTDADLFKGGDIDLLDLIIAEVEEEIDIQLKDSCPAYRHKPKKSVLPIPRVLRIGSQSILEESTEWNSPHEIAEIIERFERVTITLEPTYPDSALPWVIADAILRTNGERIFVPIVVEGEKISLGRSYLLKFPLIDRLQKLGSIGATAVIIINDPNLQSSTRTKALLEEASKLKNAKFVIIAKKFSAPILTTNFSKRFCAERFMIANYSLGALSDFVANNFGYDISEAAILATKLDETFEQFGMHAHPSYFAGISPEILSALIGANRRGELIQLAVEGALMILVAVDESEVHLSKRWRREFLKDLVVRQFVKGEKIDIGKAVELAQGMAEKKDIEIVPLSFVQSFVTSGIFNFDTGGLQFALVYVRDYFIAEYLHENPKDALAYFDFDRVDDDFNVLDIYTELGPSFQIVEKIINLIEKDVELLNERKPETIDFLMSDKIILSAASNFKRFSDRRLSLLNAIEYVGQNEGDLQRKQYLLDLQRSVSQRARQEVEDSSGDKEVKGNVDGERSDLTAAHDCSPNREAGVHDDIPRGEISAHWTAGCLILSSGAEQIDAQPKRRLAKALISLGCRIAEHWTEESAQVNFNEIRDAFLSDEEFVKRQNTMGADEWDELLKDFDHLIHVLEFSYITDPYRIILSVLCGQGDGNLLRRTVRELSVDREFEKLTKAVWASDLDAENAVNLVKGSLRFLGRSTIVRFILAEHFVSRVYWDKWRPTDRQAFLDVATKIMEGLDAQFDKGKLKRMIIHDSRKV